MSAMPPDSVRLMCLARAWYSLIHKAAPTASSMLQMLYHPGFLDYLGDLMRESGEVSPQGLAKRFIVPGQVLLP